MEAEKAVNEVEESLYVGFKVSQHIQFYTYRVVSVPSIFTIRPHIHICVTSITARTAFSPLSLPRVNRVNPLCNDNPY